MAKNWIPLRQVEGNASRQAHVRLPEGTFEREISKEGFFGPSAQFHHRHKPTDWIEFDGPIRPRALDLYKLVTAKANPWRSELVMNNAHLQMRIWKLDKPMTELARNSDGDQMLFVHEGEGDLFCDYGHLEYRDGDYIVIPRGTMWRLAPKQPTVSLMIEATNDHFTLPEKGLVGRHAIFDPAMLDTPHIDFQGTRARVIVTIREGQRFVIQHVTVAGNAAYTAAEQAYAEARVPYDEAVTQARNTYESERKKYTKVIEDVREQMEAAPEELRGKYGDILHKNHIDQDLARCCVVVYHENM